MANGNKNKYKKPVTGPQERKLTPKQKADREAQRVQMVKNTKRTGRGTGVIVNRIKKKKSSDKK